MLSRRHLLVAGAAAVGASQIQAAKAAAPPSAFVSVAPGSKYSSVPKP